MDQTETPAPGEAPIMRPLGAGDPAPTFMLPDPDDVMISSVSRTGRWLSPSTAASGAPTAVRI